MRWFSVGVEPVGFIAIGAMPTGVIALGQGATGVIAVGQLARGVVAVGQLSVGVLALGQIAAGAIWAGGQLAVGGSSGFAQLPLGLLGYWLPWRRGSFRLKPSRRVWTAALRGVVLAGVVVLVAWVAIAPLVDALTRPGGVFVPLPGLR
ncbi:MAG: hypothetical protein JW785_00360 [Acidimicrobiia bacterium]|nr:hypothetical protein [Acidimicrobiia bacterium]